MSTTKKALQSELKTAFEDELGIQWLKRQILFSLRAHQLSLTGARRTETMISFTAKSLHLLEQWGITEDSIIEQ